MDNFFKGLRNSEGLFKLRGSTVLVKLVEEELKSEGGIVIATDPNQARGGAEENKLEVGEVVMVGDGYDDEDGSKIPLDVQVGAIVILPKFGLSKISVFPGMNEPTYNKLAMVKEESVLAYYPSKEAYEQAKQLN